MGLVAPHEVPYLGKLGLEFRMDYAYWRGFRVADILFGVYVMAAHARSRGTTEIVHHVRDGSYFPCPPKAFFTKRMGAPYEGAETCALLRGVRGPAYGSPLTPGSSDASMLTATGRPRDHASARENA